MSPVDTIDAMDAFAHTKDNSAILICAYERDDKFHRLRLEGAIPLSEFQAISATLPNDKELIFY